MLFKVNMNNYYGKKRMIYNVNIYYKKLILNFFLEKRLGNKNNIYYPIGSY